MKNGLRKLTALFMGLILLVAAVPNVPVLAAESGEVVLGGGYDFAVEDGLWAGVTTPKALGYIADLPQLPAPYIWVEGNWLYWDLIDGVHWYRLFTNGEFSRFLNELSMPFALSELRGGFSYGVVELQLMAEGSFWDNTRDSELSNIVEFEIEPSILSRIVIDAHSDVQWVSPDYILHLMPVFTDQFGHHYWYGGTLLWTFEGLAEGDEYHATSSEAQIIFGEANVARTITVTAKAASDPTMIGTRVFKIKKIAMLPAPVLRLEGHMLYWDLIDGATGYRVYLDGAASWSRVSDMPLNLRKLLEWVPYDTYQIQLRVEGTQSEGISSELSNSVTFEFAPSVPTYLDLRMDNASAIGILPGETIWLTAEVLNRYGMHFWYGGDIIWTINGLAAGDRYTVFSGGSRVEVRLDSTNVDRNITVTARVASRPNIYATLVIEYTQLPQLLAPIISLDGHMVRWDEIWDADWHTTARFRVYIDGSPITWPSNVGANSFSLRTLAQDYPYGTYQIQVRALCNRNVGVRSELSNAITFELTRSVPTAIYFRVSGLGRIVFPHSRVSILPTVFDQYGYDSFNANVVLDWTVEGLVDGDNYFMSNFDFTVDIGASAVARTIIVTATAYDNPNLYRTIEIRVDPLAPYIQGFCDSWINSLSAGSQEVNFNTINIPDGTYAATVRFLGASPVVTDSVTLYGFTAKGGGEYYGMVTVANNVARLPFVYDGTANLPRGADLNLKYELILQVHDEFADIPFEVVLRNSNELPKNPEPFIRAEAFAFIADGTVSFNGAITRFEVQDSNGRRIEIEVQNRRPTARVTIDGVAQMTDMAAATGGVSGTLYPAIYMGLVYVPLSFFAQVMDWELDSWHWGVFISASVWDNMWLSVNSSSVRNFTAGGSKAIGWPVIIRNVRDFVLGDTGGTGRVTSSDATEIARRIATEGPITDWPAADLNGDGIVDTLDIVLLSRLLAGHNVWHLLG
ncbi:MAG: dockerin type I repeat-containing protein [Defluviitaleaceae bacterium]|nr:dockerin type I repeat-containing protein [Defluviitaleaceae bacterium]MCL2264096.1 dockerin type I repeat-containing protein [Defluviitaleaceae bacterium]